MSLSFTGMEDFFMIFSCRFCSREWKIFHVAFHLRKKTLFSCNRRDNQLKLENRKIAKSQNRKIAKSENRKIVKPKNRKNRKNRKIVKSEKRADVDGETLQIG